ncbi:MAG: hypothetical protein HKN77_04125, partial [Woeseiaceae bacterium]|nr:hypothetical protein [Woeseiaceae bacterium]
DLYEIDRIRNITHSVSSRWWRCNQVEAWMNDREFVLTDAFGGVFRFDLQSGDYTYDGSGNACPTALPRIAS